MAFFRELKADKEITAAPFKLKEHLDRLKKESNIRDGVFLSFVFEETDEHPEEYVYEFRDRVLRLTVIASKFNDNGKRSKRQRSEVSHLFEYSTQGRERIVMGTYDPERAGTKQRIIGYYEVINEILADYEGAFKWAAWFRQGGDRCPDQLIGTNAPEFIG